MEDEYESYDGFEPKSPSAVDFYDFDDVLSDEGELEDTSHKTVVEDVNFFDSNLNLSLPALITQTDDVVLGGEDKPLAAVLPAKYREADIHSLFPDFHHDKSLRHLKIFKIAKHNLPNLWRGVKRKKEPKTSDSKVETVVQKELEIESDEEIKFLSDKSYSEPVDNLESNINNKPLNNAWRFGAAKLWYDMVEVPETAETYDYGFKLREKNEECSTEDTADTDAFLMVNQVSWEDEVIWDGENVKEEVMQKLMSSEKPAGWIPFLADRTVSGFQEYTKGVSNRTENFTKISYEGNRMLFNKVKKNEFQSMFPQENPLLIYDRWEDDVIWDPENMARISYPRVIEIDDDNIIMDIPEDKPPDTEPAEASKDLKNKKPRPQIRKVEEEEEESSAMNKPDFFNISNDEYYNPKMTQETALKLSCSGSFLQHSIPAVELRPPYFPTHLGLTAMQRFHRPTLKVYSHGPFAYFGDFHGVHSLAKHIHRKKREREKELEESGGGEMFFMRTPADLSAQDGDLVLFEFSEEFPPLMNQVGMASKIRNHYRRRPGKDQPLKQYEYGETAYHNSPFLGALQPGESLQAYENHLYRAPIYEHDMQGTDFLIIRTRYHYFIREIKTIFTVGQQLPLVEVPAPKSEKAKSFLKDFLNVFIYRLFWQSEENPRRIRIEAVKKAFPSLREFSIRKRLNQCATFQRTGTGTKYWVLNDQFRLPSEEEIRQIISPEQCCTYYSMLSAEQRLKDAGYGDKLVAAEEDNEFLQHNLEVEVKAAPWNTTQAFIAAAEGKCMLELEGDVDPTGCREGFSYVRIPNKPQANKDDNQNPAKRLVRGTDADLRRLSLSAAKKLLKTFNVPDKEIKNMSRWEIVDVVRTLSTQQAKLAEGGIMPKFARGNFHSQAEHARRYKEECQRRFDLQNAVLSSKEVLSTDDESSSEEDSDIEEMGKHIESILTDKKTADELSHETEEAERKELQKLIASEQPIKDSQKVKEEKPSSIEGKILKIYRTYRNSDGTEYERIEIVRRPAVVELYTKIRETKNAEFVKSYSMDEEQKEAIRKEKRRIQDQLRRIKRNELKERMFEQPPKKKVKVETPSSKVTCGACGLSGHMRTNRACKMYQNSPSLPPVQVAMTEEQEEAAEKTALKDQNLIQCDETKIILSKQLVQHADEVRKKSLVIKIPKDTLAAAKKKRSYELANSDYLSTPKMINRKRTDPLVSISVIFENLINELKALPHTQAFWTPVSTKLAPDYYQVIERPMDLHSMKEQIRQHKYKSREDFIKDLQQIIDNSSKYNGPHSFLTITAHSLLEHCIKVFSEKEERLMELEKAINPLLDNDQVAFSFILESIVTDFLKTVPESWPFHKPVEKRIAKGYYDIIKQPIDLSTITSYCKVHKYRTRQAFIDDVELMCSNSQLFNGADHPLTKIARQIVERCHAAIGTYSEQLEKLEAGLKNSGGASPILINSLLPKRTRRVGRPKLNADYSAPSKYNGSADTDSYVDVESLDVIPDASSEKEYNHSDKSESIQCDSQHSFNNDLDLSEDSDGDQASDNGGIVNNNHVASSSFIDDLDLSESDPESQNDLGKSHDVHLPADTISETYNSHLNSDFTSPTVSSKTQSLQYVNGFLQVESYGEDSNSNFQLPHSQITCDNISDDLAMSDSEPEDIHLEHVLQF